MKFSIEFNREGIGTPEQLQDLGAIPIPANDEYYTPPFEIEIEDLKELREFCMKVNKMFDYEYDIIINFDLGDEASIYLDKEHK